MFRANVRSPVLLLSCAEGRGRELPENKEQMGEPSHSRSPHHTSDTARQQMAGTFMRHVGASGHEETQGHDYHHPFKVILAGQLPNELLCVQCGQGGDTKQVRNARTGHQKEE